MRKNNRINHEIMAWPQEKARYGELALKVAKLDKKFNFVSTGGGAMLEFLGGKKLPGLEALK